MGYRSLPTDGDRLDMVMGLIGFEDPVDPAFYRSERGEAY